MKRVVFLDRDGTVIEDLHYPREAARVVLVPGAAAGMRLMIEKGYALCIVSNQSGVGRGIIKDFEFKAVHDRTQQLLEQESVSVAGYGYCFHIPSDNCKCRKPEIGLIPENFRLHELDKANSFTVGDKLCDLELGDNLGVKAFLVSSGKGAKTWESLSPDQKLKYDYVNDLLEMAQSLPSIYF